MALEQTVNRDSETKGGIIGVSGMENARDRWASPVHDGSSNNCFQKDEWHRYSFKLLKGAGITKHGKR